MVCAICPTRWRTSNLNIEPEYDDFDDMMEVDEAPVEEEKPADQPAEQPTDQPAATGEVDEFEVVTGPE